MPEDLEVVRDILATAISAASEASVRYRLLQADGQPCWVVAGCIPSFVPPDNTFIGYLGSLTRLADDATEGITAYGNVGRYVPPPTHSQTEAADHLDRIADHLILAHALIDSDGVKSALPGLRIALFEVGRALAARVAERRTLLN